MGEEEDADSGTVGAGWLGADAQLVVEADVPAGLANAAAEGTSENVSRGDHQHKRDVRVKKDGSDVATRNALDMRGYFLVTDDPGNDEVDVSIDATALVGDGGGGWYKHFLMRGFLILLALWPSVAGAQTQFLTGRQWDMLEEVLAPPVLLLRDGSATAPSYSFANATGGGMFLDPATVTTVELKGKDGSGTDAGGGNVLIPAGRGTGAAAGGFWAAQITPAGAASGSSLNTSVNWLSMVASNGAITLGNINIPGAVSDLTLRATSRAAGVTDGAGGNVFLDSGVGTGAAPATIVSVRTPTVSGSGSVQQSLVTRLTIAQHTHIGAADDPTLSACGTSPSIVGGDQAGKVTTGSGAITSCTVTFARAYVVAPACFANDETTIQLVRAVSTTTTLTLDCSGAGCLESEVISYWCVESN